MSIVKIVFVGYQKTRGQKVLSKRDYGFAVLGGYEILLDLHEYEGFGLGLPSLGHMDVHFIAVEVGIIWGAHTLIEPQGVPLHDPNPMGHHGHAVQRRLSVEQHHVVLQQVSEQHVADLQVLHQLSNIFRVPPVAVGEDEPLSVLLQKVVGPWVAVGSVQQHLLHLVHVLGVDGLREGEFLGHGDGHDQLVDSDVRVWRNDRPRREVHPLGTQVGCSNKYGTSEPAGLALQPGHQRPDVLLQLVRGQSWSARVYVLGVETLKQVPLVVQPFDL